MTCLLVFVYQLIPLQAPLKAMLQMSVVPVINSKSQNNDSRTYWLCGNCGTLCLEWTKRGVGIPLPDGLDLIEEIVEYHNVSKA